MLWLGAAMPLAAAEQATSSPLPAVAAAGTSLAATGSAPLSGVEGPDSSRLPVMFFGIAAVAYTFHRAVFRRRQAA